VLGVEKETWCSAAVAAPGEQALAEMESVRSTWQRKKFTKVVAPGKVKKKE